MKKSDPNIPNSPDSVISADTSRKSKKKPPKMSGITPAISGITGSDVVSDVVKAFFKEFYSLVKFCVRLIKKEK